MDLSGRGHRQILFLHNKAETYGETFNTDMSKGQKEQKRREVEVSYDRNV